MSGAGTGLFLRVVRRPLLLVLAAVVSTGGLALFAIGLPTDNGIDIWLPEGDADRVAYEEFRKAFGNDDFILVAGIDRPADELRADLDHLAASLSNLEGVAGIARPSFTGFPATPLFARGEDGLDSAALLVRFQDGLGSSDRAALVDGVTAIADRSDRGPWRIAGPAVINRSLDLAARSSFETLVPLTVAGVALVLLLGLKSLRSAVVVIASAGLSCGATMGLVGVAGGSMNMVVSVLPALTLVLGTAYALHPVARYLSSEVREDEGAEERWARVLADTFRPALAAAATTAAGLGSLCLAGLPPVRALGLFGSLGIALSFVLSYTFVPAALSLLRLRPSPRPAPGAGRLADLLAGAVVRRKVWIAATVLAVVVFSVVGLTRLRVESSVLRILDPDSRVLADSGIIEDRLTGLTPLELWIEGDREAMLSAPTTEAVMRLVAACGDLDRVTNVVSPATSPANLRVDGNRADLRITVLSLLGNSRQFLALTDSVRRLAKAAFPPDITTRVTGAIPLLTRVQNSLVGSQIRSFGAAFVLVSLLLLLDLRRPGLAALSLVPNVLPVLVAAGAMGWLGIPLDAATMAVAGIAFGIAVDDTVHIIHRWSATGGNLKTVLRVTIRPVLLTTLAAIGGFAAFAASPFPPARRLGLLVAGAAAAAVVADLVLLPALLITLDSRKKELSP